MKKVRSLIREAIKKIDVADHLIYVTYPAINEAKMLYVVAENIATAVNKLMLAIVRYDRLYKVVPLLERDYASEFMIFRNKCAVRHRIDKKYIMAIAELNRIVSAKRNSPITFIRKDKFIICGDGYTKIKELSLTKVKEYVNLSKGFIEKTNRIVKC